MSDYDDNFEFNPTEYEAADYDGFEPIPTGEYEVCISNAELRRPKNGGNRMLTLTFDVTGEKYHGRKVFSNLCIAHPKQEVREIASRLLTAICQAVGFSERLTQHNLEALCDVAMIARIRCKDGQNNVQGVKGISTAGKPLHKTESVEKEPEKDWSQSQSSPLQKNGFDPYKNAIPFNKDDLPF